MKVWGPERKPNRRKSDQDGHVESTLSCLGRPWLQVGLSWEMLEARWSGMERLRAPRGATRGSQTRRPHPLPWFSSRFGALLLARTSKIQLLNNSLRSWKNHENRGKLLKIQLLNDSLRSWKNHENRCIERREYRKPSFSMIH